MLYCLFLNCSQASVQARTLRSYLPFLHHGALVGSILSFLCEEIHLIICMVPIYSAFFKDSVLVWLRFWYMFLPHAPREMIGRTD